MRRIVLFVLGSIAWTIFVFALTFRLTFPSTVIADRLRYEVPGVMGREYSAEIGSVVPWWIGLSVDDVKLYKTGRPAPASAAGSDGEDAPVVDGPQLVGLLSNARLRVSPWSLLRRAPYVRGSVTLTEGVIDYSVGTAVAERGNIELADLVLSADALPLADVFVLIPGFTASGTGAIDLAIDLHAGENGMKDATGKVSITGKDLGLSDLELPSTGPLGIEIPISDLEIVADVVDGKATITDGHLVSDLLTLQITGEVTLRDPLDRSAIDLTVSLSKLGEQLAPYEAFLSEAKQSDGSYQYSCRGVISRLGAYSCTPGSRSPRVSSRGASSSGVAMPPRPSRADETDEERDKRREELRERLRQRREEREAERPGAIPLDPETNPDEDPENAGDPSPIDEPHDGEEDPIDLDGPPDEEPPE
ncbi:MAG: type II secretion system protein GspN [Myxococcota bacterium]